MIWEFDGKRFEQIVVIFKVKEEFGELSNMSNEFPLQAAGLNISSSEALYQACRYPHRPDWQREIFEAPHAMQAKMKAKKEGRRQQSRPDWAEVQLDVMRWVLRVKLAQHRRFRGVLRWTGDRPIVERSRRDRFWGAVVEKDDVLRGENWLGRLLMELRAEMAQNRSSGEEDRHLSVTPPAISGMSLLGREIGVIEAK
ncbi:MAG: NADAR family protein [Planctomycetota bacterium]